MTASNSELIAIERFVLETVEHSDTFDYQLSNKIKDYFDKLRNRASLQRLL